MPLNGIRKLKNEVVVREGLCAADDIFCHEEVIVERMESLYQYLISLGKVIIIPSILVCSTTKVLIDGHHRYHALKKLGIDLLPVTFLDYDSKKIIPHLDNSITKSQVLESATNGVLLKPKSSFHHIVDSDGKARPIVLMGQLVDISV